MVGRAAWACVYKAFDRDLGRTVAIKTLHGIDQHQPTGLPASDVRPRRASRVVHPNLVIIYSSGTHGDTPLHRHGVLVRRSLAAEIADGPLSVERTADLLGAACAGVYAAHRANVVHATSNGQHLSRAARPWAETPKILDFGISRVGGDEPASPARVTSSAPPTTSRPEQAAGREIDARPTSTPWA